MPGVRAGAITLCAIAVLLACGPTAQSDTAPIPTSPDLPWTNPTHQSSLEVLASQIATHIAGRPVTVKCEARCGRR